MGFRIGIVKRADSDDQVDKDAKNAFKVIALTIAEEATNHKNGKDEYNGVKNFEIKVHFVAETPRNEDD